MSVASGHGMAAGMRALRLGRSHGVDEKGEQGYACARVGKKPREPASRASGSSALAREENQAAGRKKRTPVHTVVMVP